MQQDRFFAAEEGLVVAAAQIVDVAVEGLDLDLAYYGPLALSGAFSLWNKGVAGLADDQVPRLASRQGGVLDDPTSLLSPVADAGRDAVHGTKPRQFENQLPADRGGGEFTIPGDIAIAACVALQESKEVVAGHVPQPLGDVL